jgi:replicative DNA helicase
MTDEIKNKVLEKLQQQQEAEENNKVTQKDLDTLKSSESIIDMVYRIKQYNEMLKQKMTFITKGLTRVIPFTKNNLYLICGYSGNGKCFAKDTPIRMFDGSIKLVQDIKEGDLLMGPDNKERTVTGLARGKEQMYKIKQKMGEDYTVNESHILCLTNNEDKSYMSTSVKEYLKFKGNKKRVYKGYSSDYIHYPSKKLKIDPYFLGNWFGCRAMKEDSPLIIDRYNALFSDFECDKEAVLDLLSKINAKEVDRSIPLDYQVNSKENRLAFLAGVVDRCGVCSPRRITITTSYKQFASDLISIVKSLGNLNAYIMVNKNKNKYTIKIYGDLHTIPTNKPADFEIKNIRHNLTKIEVIPMGEGDYYGFTLKEEDRRFLLKDYTVVHNTTVSANIAYPLWQEGKKILWISNEESKEDIIMRIACIHLGYSFNDFKKGFMEPSKIKDIISLFPEINRYVTVFDVTYKDGITTRVEGVKQILELAKDTDEYSCILIDYYQLIKYSEESGKDNTYTILDNLRIYLMRYIKKSNIPVVLFAQLHSLGKRNNKSLDSRVKDGPTIIEAATVIIEIVPDYQEETTDFVIHKDRFGIAGNRVKLGFEKRKGKFVDYDLEFNRKVKELKLKEVQENIDNREGGKDED